MLLCNQIYLGFIRGLSDRAVPASAAGEDLPRWPFPFFLSILRASYSTAQIILGATSSLWRFCQYAMTFLQYARRLYSLDTLDTRFTTSSRTPPQESALDTRSRIDPARPSPGENGSHTARVAGSKIDVGTSPPRWWTPEFFVYYIVFIILVPMMFKATYDVSKR